MNGFSEFHCPLILEYAHYTTNSFISLYSKIKLIKISNKSLINMDLSTSSSFYLMKIKFRASIYLKINYYFPN